MLTQWMHNNLQFPLCKWASKNQSEIVRIHGLLKFRYDTSMPVFIWGKQSGIFASVLRNVLIHWATGNLNIRSNFSLFDKNKYFNRVNCLKFSAPFDELSLLKHSHSSLWEFIFIPLSWFFSDYTIKHTHISKHMSGTRFHQCYNEWNNSFC